MIFIGISDIQPNINPEEVESWKYMRMEDIREDMKTNPGLYTEWFKIAFEEVSSHFTKR